MNIALVQFNPTVGDLIGNADRIIEFCRKAMDSNATAIVFPELAITGYPPEALLLRDEFLRALEALLDRITSACSFIIILLG